MDVLRFIYEFGLEKGYAPTIREIGAGIGLTSCNAVMDHIKRLQAKGALRREPNVARTIRLAPAVIRLLDPERAKYLDVRFEREPPPPAA
jgi:repressor LexA